MHIAQSALDWPQDELRVKIRPLVLLPIRPVGVLNILGRVEIRQEAERSLEFESADGDLALKNLFGAMHLLCNRVAVHIERLSSR